MFTQYWLKEQNTKRLPFKLILGNVIFDAMYYVLNSMDFGACF